MRKVRKQVIESTDMPILHDFVLDNADENTFSYTKKNKSFGDLKNREFVNYLVSQYVNGQAGTNWMESFCTTQKCGYNSTFHYIAPQQCNGMFTYLIHETTCNRQTHLT